MGFSKSTKNFTYAAHPLGAATALANLEIIQREGLIAKVRDTGPYLLKRLNETFGGHEMVGDIRGAGLLACIELVASRNGPVAFDEGLGIGAKLALVCREEGVIVRPLPQGDIVGFSPPLIVDRDDIDEIIIRCKRAFDGVVESMVRAGTWRPN